MIRKSSLEIARDNRANQLNPAHPAYHLSRGATSREAEFLAAHYKATLDNRAKQLDPINDINGAARKPGKRPKRDTRSTPSNAPPL
jgi:hypothetical protein